MEKISTIEKNNFILYFTIVLSVFFPFFFLLIESVSGISWDFHPDSRTYLEKSNFISNHLSILSFHSSNFYEYVNFFGSNRFIIILMNIIFYIHTNFLLINFYKKNNLLSFNFTTLFLLIVLFDPYRIHLSIVVLKDTLIIYFLVLSLLTKNFFLKFLYIFFLYSFSLRSLIYLFTFISRKNFLIIFSIIIALLLMISFDFSNFLINNRADMSFRSFDNIPSFHDMGLAGSILRSIFWPLIYFSGMFIVLSPSIIFLPTAIAPIFFLMWVFSTKKVNKIFIIFICVSIVAFAVSGFTSFLRYAIPVITVAPLLILKN